MKKTKYKNTLKPSRVNGSNPGSYFSSFIKVIEIDTKVASANLSKPLAYLNFEL